MSKNKKIVWGIVGIIVLIVVFYGGVVFGKNGATTKNTGVQTFAQNGNYTRGTRSSAGGGFGGATSGKIISEDAQSITISLTDGSSKIIFLDSSTPITKSASGSLTDLAVGTEVSVMGATNADGSINAQAVQIRPNTPTPAAQTPNPAQ